MAKSKPSDVVTWTFTLSNCGGKPYVQMFDTKQEATAWANKFMETGMYDVGPITRQATPAPKPTRKYVQW